MQAKLVKCGIQRAIEEKAQMRGREEAARVGKWKGEQSAK